ncbi:MAG: hypothetical protein RSE41_03055, partial [Clostridia bacterium]
MCQIFNDHLFVKKETKGYSLYFKNELVGYNYDLYSYLDNILIMKKDNKINIFILLSNGNLEIFNSITQKVFVLVDYKM